MTWSRLHAVRRPFENARARFCAATSSELQYDEMSNMLHHLYRLIELKGNLNRPRFDAASF